MHLLRELARLIKRKDIRLIGLTFDPKGDGLFDITFRVHLPKTINSIKVALRKDHDEASKRG